LSFRQSLRNPFLDGQGLALSYPVAQAVFEPIDDMTQADPPAIRPLRNPASPPVTHPEDSAIRGSTQVLEPSFPTADPRESPDEPIDFRHADFAITVRMENSNNGTSRYFVSSDRGHTWRGPYRLPLFGQKGPRGRTGYLVSGPRECLLFLTATKADGREGRPFSARTTDGGRSWEFLAVIGLEPSGYAIMPSTVRVSATDLVTTIRRKDPPTRWIDAYASHDDGRSWEFLSTPEPDTGEGNPPSLLKLTEGRLCLIYGVRARPYGIRARLSADRGRTWGNAETLRDDGANDVGYVRSVLRPDGKVVAIYYFADRTGPTRYIAATIWDPREE
jgi:hypothetical protein